MSPRLPEDTSRLSPEDARQGRKGVPVLGVLVTGLLLAAIAGAGIMAYFWLTPDRGGVEATIGGNAGSSPPVASSSAAPGSAAPGSTVTPAQTGTDPAAPAPQRN